MGRLVISIMIVGELDLVRGALAAVLAQEDDLEVTSELPVREPAVTAADVRQPAVVILDLDQYGSDGLDTVRRLTEELPESRILVLTGQQAPELLRHALAAQVWGLVSAEASPDQLAAAIRQVAGGRRVIEAVLAAAALRPSRNPLTEQERSVLRLAGDGMRSREIAAQLYLSPGTVRNYLSAAMRKTGGRTRLEAVRVAKEAGWI